MSKQKFILTGGYVGPKSIRLRDAINAKLVKKETRDTDDWRSMMKTALSRGELFVLLIGSHCVSDDGSLNAEMDDALDVLATDSRSAGKIHVVYIDETESNDKRLKGLPAHTAAGDEVDYNLIKRGIEGRTADTDKSSATRSQRREGGERRGEGIRGARSRKPPRVALGIVWDPEVLQPEEYAELVALLGDVARSAGALGIERVDEIEALVPEGAMAYR